MSNRPSPPSGTQTFLFTDIGGSTQLWEQYPDAMRAALARHDALLTQIIAAHNGYVFKTVGDQFCVAFATAHDALTAIVAIQRALVAEAWPAFGLPEPIRVRAGIHTGAAQERDGDYFGPPVNRVARIQSTAHPGQTVVSHATAALLRDHLSSAVALRDLGAHRLKDLTHPEQIYQVVVPDLPASFPPLKSLDARHHNLPSIATTLIGRAQELTATRTILQRPDVRLVTLIGPGGTGKTRLALQTAAELIDEYADGVCFVALAPVTDPALVCATIAQALDLRVGSGQPMEKALADYLRDKQLLLVIDNFEQVVAAAGEIATLLQGAPQLKVLVTSRIVLQLAGEQEFPVPPLHLPDLRQMPTPEHLSQYEAVALFIARAQAVQPGFAITNATAPAVAEICIRLDGLPLAIELAAARIRLFPPEALLARLTNQGVLPVLTGGARDLPARQQTIRATITWSYDLLAPTEQRLFARLGVFAGSFDLEAVAAVCDLGDLGSDLVELLERLLTHSLVQSIDAAGMPRLTMLETIRAFAREQLTRQSEHAVLSQRHATHFAALATQGEIALRGPAQLEWLHRLEREYENMRAALAWCGDLVSDAALGLRLAASLARFWQMRGMASEASTWLSGALDHAAQLPGLEIERAHALIELSALLRDYGQAQRMLEEAIALARATNERWLLSRALMQLTPWLVDRPAQSRPLAEESLALAHELNDRWLIAAVIDLAVGSLPIIAEEEQQLGKAVALFREVGDRWSYACLLLNYAWRDDTLWEEQVREALEIFRSFGDRNGEARALEMLGQVLLTKGDFAQSAEFQVMSLALVRESGDQVLLRQALLRQGEQALWTGDYMLARTLLDEHLRLCRALNDRALRAETLHLLGDVSREQGEYTLARQYFSECRTIHEELQEPNLVASDLCGLGDVAFYEGQLTEATDLYQTSNRIFRQVENSEMIGIALRNQVRVAMVQGNNDLAASFLDESSALLGHTHFLGPWVNYEQAQLALLQGNVGLAVALFCSVLRQYRRRGRKSEIALTLESLARVATAQSVGVQAARWWGAAGALRAQIGAPLPPVWQPMDKQAKQAARSQIGDTAFDAAMAAGTQLSWEAAAEEALTYYDRT